MTAADARDPALVARVVACALGLAVAGREDAQSLRELVDLAGGREQVLLAARTQLAGMDMVPDDTREQAHVLLYAAASHLDRLLLIEDTAAAGDTRPTTAPEPAPPR